MPTQSKPGFYRPAVFGAGVTNQGQVHFPIVVKYYTDTRITSSQVRNWRQLLSLGRDVTTTLYGTKYSVKPGRGTTTYINKVAPAPQLKATGDIVGGYLSFQHPTGVVSGQASTKAARSIVKKLRESQTTWSAGTFAGELLEAVRFFKNPLKSLYRQTDEYIGRLGTLKKVYKTDKTQYRRRMAQSYLAYKFAVQPTINDLRDAGLAIDSIRYGRRQKLRFTGVGEAQHQYSEYRFDSYTPLGGVPYPPGFWVSDTELSTVTYRAGLIPNETGEIPPISEFGLTLPDLAVTAWELVPFSFIADYITNVDEILDALAVLTLDFAYLNRTVRNIRQTRLSDVYDKYAGDGNINVRHTAYGGGCSCSVKTVSRERVAPLTLVPSMRLKLPTHGQKLNMAVLAQAFQQARPTSFL